MKASTRLLQRFIIFAMMTFGCISGCERKVTFQWTDTRKIGNYTVTLSLPSQMLDTTRTPFQLAILDSARKPIKNAKITVRYSLPPLPGANVPDRVVVPRFQENKWVSHLDFSIPGMWIVTPYIVMNNHETCISFNVLVR